MGWPQFQSLATVDQVELPLTSDDSFGARPSFPLLDSFPSTLFGMLSDYSGRSIDLCASLSTTSRTRDNVLAIRDRIRLTVDRDERESMYNDLTHISESYRLGWESELDSMEED